MKRIKLVFAVFICFFIFNCATVPEDEPILEEETIALLDEEEDEEELPELFEDAIVDLAEQELPELNEPEDLEQTVLPQIIREPGKIYIEDSSSFNVSNIVDFIMSRNPPVARSYIDELINVYIIETEIEGINEYLAVAQMLYATDYLRHNELRNEYNYAGLAPVSGTTRIQFSSREQGVCAHIQHLKGYSSAELNNPVMTIVDPRRDMLRDFSGTIQTLDELAKKWAPNNSIQYESRIISIINDLKQASAR